MIGLCLRLSLAFIPLHLMLLRAVNAGWLGGGLGFGDSIYSLHLPGEAAAEEGRKEGG
jgi:hypothetical protein